jgi:hypothetical protein
MEAFSRESNSVCDFLMVSSYSLRISFTENLE